MSCEGCHHNRDGICGVDGEPIENIAQDEECWCCAPIPSNESDSDVPPESGQSVASLVADRSTGGKKYKTVEEFLDAAIDEGLKEGTKASLKVVKKCRKAKQWLKKPGIGSVILTMYERELKKSGWM